MANINKMTFNKNTIIISASILIFLLLGTIVIVKFISTVKKLNPDKKASEYYREDVFSGLVLNKYIDSKQHNYKTLIVGNDNKEHRILFDFEIGGLYEFIQIGDSIFKKKDTLDVRLKRNKMDTIITMKIYDK